MFRRSRVNWNWQGGVVVYIRGILREPNPQNEAGRCPTTVTATITGEFASLPVAGAPAPPGRDAPGGQQAPPASLAVRDVWAGKYLGTFAGGYTAKAIPPHGTVVLKLTKPAP